METLTTNNTNVPIVRFSMKQFLYLKSVLQFIDSILIATCTAAFTLVTGHDIFGSILFIVATLSTLAFRFFLSDYMDISDVLSKRIQTGSYIESLTTTSQKKKLLFAFGSIVGIAAYSGLALWNLYIEPISSTRNLLLIGAMNFALTIASIYVFERMLSCMCLKNIKFHLISTSKISLGRYSLIEIMVLLCNPAETAALKQELHSLGYQLKFEEFGIFNF